MSNCYLCHRPVGLQRDEWSKFVWWAWTAATKDLPMGEQVLMEEFVHRSCLDLAERLINAESRSSSAPETHRTQTEQSQGDRRSEKGGGSC